MLRKILVVILLIIVVIQFIHSARNVSAGPQPYNIAGKYELPADVKIILAKACFDCHSNNTRYKWYFKIQPVDWWLTDHINVGKEELNFDEFTNAPARRQYHRMESMAGQVKKDMMPLPSYLWIHKDAVLTSAEKTTLINWAQGIAAQMKLAYPADSLANKDF